MQQVVKTTTLALMIGTSVSACATKGFVREQVGVLRDSTILSVAAERDARIAADNASQADIARLRGDLEALRGALDSLRSEFNVKITALEDGMRFAMPVYFGFNQATVREEDRAVLDRFIGVAQKYYPSSMITVEGFADPAGSAMYNQRLSLRRAEAVKGYLTERGLSSDQLRAMGYGETRQVTLGASGEDPGAERNRRVVFVIESGSPDSTVAMVR